MSQDNFARLSSLGFIWKSDEASWESFFEELVVYKGEHGDCNVPNRYNANRALGSWVGNQRSRRRQGKLRKERIVRLDEIGFIWDTLDATWEEMYAALVKFKNKHRHCNVPYKWKENSTLAQWVATRRSEYRRNVLAQDKVAQLESIGFEWGNPK